MKVSTRSRAVASGASLVGVAGLVVAGLLTASGSGSADPVSLTLNYTCPFPLIGSQSIKVVITSDIPSTIGVGQATPPFDIKAVSTVPATATQGLNLVGAAFIAGTAKSSASVAVPEGNLDVEVPVDIQKTPVPADGTFDIVATGTTPSLTFTKAGKGTISVGALNMTLTPTKADGSPTGLGTFPSACTQDPGQNNVLTTFEILDHPVTSTTTTTTTTSSGTVTSTTTTTKTTTSTTTTTNSGTVTSTTGSSSATSTTTGSGTTSSSPTVSGTGVTTTSEAGPVVPAGYNAPANTPPTSSGLAYTGASVLAPIGLGVLLLGGGVALLLVQRRRRSRA
jgi:hypothetical protein